MRKGCWVTTSSLHALRSTLCLQCATMIVRGTEARPALYRRRYAASHAAFAKKGGEERGQQPTSPFPLTSSVPYRPKPLLQITTPLACLQRCPATCHSPQPRGCPLGAAAAAVDGRALKPRRSQLLRHCHGRAHVQSGLPLIATIIIERSSCRTSRLTEGGSFYCGAS